MLVTGAARGIGAAIARRAASEGAAVALVDLDGHGAERVADELARADATAVAGEADVATREGCERAVELAAAGLDGLDGLVNNAGVLREQPLGEVTDDAWDLTVAVNLTAPLRLTQLVLPWFDAAGGGSIVNISSIEGLRVRPGHAAYAATKGALLQLTRTTAIELGPRNIRANAVCPGSIETELFRSHVDALPDPDAAVADLIARNFLGRLGRPEEVAAAVVHLLSDEAAFTTGQHYVIDGARTVTT